MSYMNKRIVAVLPAKSRSVRVPYKNLRYLGGKPLVQHMVESCKKVLYFDEVFILSPDIVLKRVADRLGVSFFHLRRWKQDRVQTNDDFMFEFISYIKCDIVILCNPTSPFIDEQIIYSFIDFMLDNNLETVHSVKNVFSQVLYKDKPVNFDPDGCFTFTQDLCPVKIFVNGLMGFDCVSFLDRFKRLGYASFGMGGSVGYFVLSGLDAIDIDWEDDFRIAEYLFDGKSKLKGVIK